MTIFPFSFQIVYEQLYYSMRSTILRRYKYRDILLFLAGQATRYPFVDPCRDSFKNALLFSSRSTFIDQKAFQLRLSCLLTHMKYLLHYTSFLRTVAARFQGDLVAISCDPAKRPRYLDSVYISGFINDTCKALIKQADGHPSEQHATKSFRISRNKNKICGIYIFSLSTFRFQISLQQTLHFVAFSLPKYIKAQNFKKYIKVTIKIKRNISLLPTWG